MSGNEFQKHKKNDKIKWAFTGIAFVLLFVMVVGLCLQLFGTGKVKPSEWFKKADNEQTEELPEGDENEGGAEVSNIQSNGIKLLSARLLSSEYEAYGVSAQAETAYTLTATVYPEDASNKEVDWTIAFKNGSSSWATGKTVTDYVTVTPSADGSLTAVVENIAAFGEQIVVTVTSRENSSAYATCTVEYLQRTTGYTFNLDGKTYSTTGTTTNAVTPTFTTTKSVSAAITVDKSTVYTRENTDSATYFSIKPTAELEAAITEAGLASVGLKEYSGSANATLSGFFDSVWGTALYSDNTQKNALITALSNFSGNAYEITVYTVNGGASLATFYLTFDSSVIAGQKGVESITVDQTELVF